MHAVQHAEFPVVAVGGAATLAAGLVEVAAPTSRHKRVRCFGRRVKRVHARCGTGVAALAVAYAGEFSALTVVGLDVLPRVLALGEETVRTSSVTDRVVLRNQDVSTLEDVDTYALAWLRTPSTRRQRSR